MTATGCGGDAGPAGYVGRASNAVVYVSWTSADNSLSGQLTQARAADDVTEGTVATTRVSFDGTRHGSSVSLKLDEGLGSTSTLTGTLDGDTLALDYPGADGAILTIELHEGDSATFNTALASLRDRAQRAADDAQRAAVEAQQEADQAAADQQALEDATAAASGVRASLDALDRAAANATAHGPDLYQSDLDTVRSSLDTVTSSYDVITQDLANGSGDTVCSDASVVSDDVDNLEHDIDSMRGDVKTTSDASVLDADIRDLRGQLRQLQAFDPSLLPDDAPTHQEVETAIRAARRSVRAKGQRGAKFGAAQKLLAQAQAIEAKANAACRAQGG